MLYFYLSKSYEMKKLLILSTAALLISGVSFGHDHGKKKGAKASKSCCKNGKSCCKDKEKTEKTAKM